MTETKLWLLRPVEGLTEYDPWKPWFDKCFGFVVRADTKQHAREIADSQSKSEAGDWNGKSDAWLNEKYSTCDELTIAGPEEVIIQDVHMA